MDKSGTYRPCPAPYTPQVKSKHLSLHVIPGRFLLPHRLDNSPRKIERTGTSRDAHARHFHVCEAVLCIAGVGDSLCWTIGLRQPTKYQTPVTGGYVLFRQGIAVSCTAAAGFAASNPRFAAAVGKVDIGPPFFSVFRFLRAPPKGARVLVE